MTLFTEHFKEDWIPHHIHHWISGFQFPLAQKKKKKKVNKLFHLPLYLKFISRGQTMTLLLFALLFYIRNQCRWRHTTWILYLIQMVNQIKCFPQCFLYLFVHTQAEMPKVKESIILSMQEIPLLIRANTKAGERPQTLTTATQGETSVNFLHTATSLWLIFYTDL